MASEFLSSLVTVFAGNTLDVANTDKVQVKLSHEKTFTDFSHDPNYEGSHWRILYEGAPLVCIDYSKQKYGNMTWTEWFNPLRDVEYIRYLLFCLALWVSYRILRRGLAHMIICIWKLSQPLHIRTYVSTNEHTRRQFASDSNGPFSASSTENIQSFTTEYRQSHTAMRPVTGGVRMLSALYILLAVFVVTIVGYVIYYVAVNHQFLAGFLAGRINYTDVNMWYIAIGFCVGQFRILNFCVQAVLNGAANIPQNVNAKSPRRLSRSSKSRRNQTPNHEDEKESSSDDNTE